jgi:hypothetical protein
MKMRQEVPGASRQAIAVAMVLLVPLVLAFAAWQLALGAMFSSVIAAAPVVTIPSVQHYMQPDAPDRAPLTVAEPAASTPGPGPAHGLLP